MSLIMSFRFAAALSFFVIAAIPAISCEMHNSSAANSPPAIDPIQTASMEMAAPIVAGDLTIDGYWVKAMLPGQPVAGGFLKITNKGADDKLISATSPKSPRLELHEMAMKGDVMEMRALESGIAIPAGATIELAPGGLHIMFFDVTETFKDGDMVPMTLTFEKAGTVELNVPVLAKEMKH
jgi:periplasmic copper chaperone A